MLEMSEFDDTRDRVIRMEAEIDHMQSQLTDMQKKVTAMHDLLMQAKGMRWLVMVMAAAAGVASSFAAKLLPFWK